MKKVKLNLNLEVPDNFSKEQIADLIKETFKGKKVDLGKVSLTPAPDSDDDIIDIINVRVVDRNIVIDEQPTGYESRLWSKATC